MTAQNKKPNLDTKNEITWCPGCWNYLVLNSVKKALGNLIASGIKHEELAMVVGIGCHAKIFDYLNISGIYGLHGRVLPTMLGIKLGNPNLSVIGFAGDGDTYSEGMEHFIHACRYNADMTLVVFDNRAFSLTTGQSTPTSQLGYKNKAEPLGEFNFPMNPLKLALVSGATFVARCNAKDLVETPKIIEQAVKHKGFAFVELLEDCLIFNPSIKEVEGKMYKLDERKRGMDEVMKLAGEWDYNSKSGKIPLGIFYQEEKPILEDKWPQLLDLKKKKLSWNGLKK